MLERLELQDIGPAPRMQFELAPRLNLMTGDNGLGKSFVLDLVWWALTRRWAGSEAIPTRFAPDHSPTVDFRSTEAGHALAQRWVFDRQKWKWQWQHAHEPAPTAREQQVLEQVPVSDALAVYVQVDSRSGIPSATRSMSLSMTRSSSVHSHSASPRTTCGTVFSSRR